MTSFISSFTDIIYSQFPQNEHTAKVAEIDSEIQGLTTALTNTTSVIYKNKIVETKVKLISEKETCLSTLTRLNGEFFQDPRSTLKKAWDNVVTSVQEALKLKVESREQLQHISTQLKSVPVDETIEKAESSIYYYTHLEKTRNNAETRLNEIINVEKADLIDPLSENVLRQRQKELCGNYYQDPNSLLDKAWKAYQEALSENSDSVCAPALLEKYNLLEKERKHTEILLKRFNSAARTDRGIEAFTNETINAEITTLMKERINESALKGIDWKKTVAAASGIAATGYTVFGILPPTPAAELILSNI